MDIAIKADIDVIKQRIYEVRGLRLRSQFVTSCLKMDDIENTMRFAVRTKQYRVMSKTNALDQLREQPAKPRKKIEYKQSKE
ncbi:MAG: hypothetical protein IK010_07805 [Bacteroidales bacterium]|nr:hypothetical protein [Bacteroidales bacterium]